MANRYDQPLRLQQNIKPLELDFNMLAMPLLQKQQAYDQGLDQGYTLLENLKANPLSPAQKEYAAKKKEDIQGFLDEYSRQDLSDPLIKKKMLLGVKQMVNDPLIAGMNADYEHYNKQQEFLTKQMQEGKPIASHNAFGYNTWYSDRINDKTDQNTWGKGHQNVYGNIDRWDEAKKVLSVVGEDNIANIIPQRAPDGSIEYWKITNGGKSKEKLTGAAHSALSGYFHNTSSEYNNMYGMLSSTSPTSLQRTYKDKKTGKEVQYNADPLILAQEELLSFADAYKTQKYDIDFMSDYTNWGVKQKELAQSPDWDVAPVIEYDARVPRIKPAKVGDPVPSNTTGSTETDLSFSTNTISTPEALEAANAKTYNNLQPTQKRVVDEAARAANLPPTATHTEKIAAYDAWYQKNGKLASIAPIHQRVAYYDGTRVDADDTAEVHKRAENRVVTNATKIIGEDGQIIKDIQKQLKPGSLRIVGAVTPDSGTGEWLNGVNQSNTGDDFNEAPIVRYETKEGEIKTGYITQPSSYKEKPEGQLSMAVHRNSSTIKNAPGLYFPMQGPEGKTITDDNGVPIEQTFNPENQTITLRGNNVADYLVAVDQKGAKTMLFMPLNPQANPNEITVPSSYIYSLNADILRDKGYNITGQTADQLFQRTAK